VLSGRCGLSEVCAWGCCLRRWQADSIRSLFVRRQPVSVLVKAAVLLLLLRSCWHCICLPPPSRCTFCHGLYPWRAPQFAESCIFRLMPTVTGILANAADYYRRRCLRGSFVSAKGLCHALGCANPWTVPLSFRTSAGSPILKIPDVVSNTFQTLPNSDLLAATSRSICRCCPSSPVLGYASPIPR
jgi:hypothetical protein